MSEQNKTAFPLSWPLGWPVTEPGKRESGKFKQSLATALANLKQECARLGGTELVLSSNYTLGCERPANPGVVAYFTLNKTQIAIPCDRWRLVEHNVQAIALTIEAMRGMERWGAKHMITAMFTGFKALPGLGESSGEKPWEVLGVAINAKEEQINEAFRTKAKVVHPDNPDTGDVQAFHRLQRAHHLLMQNLPKT